MKSSRLFTGKVGINPRFAQFARDFQEMARDRKIIRINGLDIPAIIEDTPVTRITQGLQLYPIAFLDGVSCALSEVGNVVEELRSHFSSPFALAALAIMANSIDIMKNNPE